MGGSSSLATFASALLTAFSLAAPVQGETGTASSALSTWGGLEAGGYGDGSTDNTDPKAFVNIVLFDQNYNFLDVAYAQLKETSLYYMTASYTVKEPGYAYLYVSNEQAVQTDVYFDDVKMTYTPTNIIQSNDYYAFGLQHNTSWTRDNSSNNFLYDGGSEINTTTNWYDLPARNYDPALGRFFQIDPLAHADHTLTPFHYAGNNPIGFNDPTGLIKRYDANGGMGDWEDDAGDGPVRNHDGGGESGDTGVSSFREESRMMNALRMLFPDATFGSGGLRGFYIKIMGIDYSTEGAMIEGLPSTATVINRLVFVSGVSVDHFETMMNPLVQAIHQGQEDFVNNPMGGFLMAFLSGAPAMGLGRVFGAVGGLMRASSPYLMRGGQAIMQAASTGGRVVLNNLVKTGARNILINGIGQAAFSGGDFNNIDKADLAISAIAGNSFVFAGILSGLLDWKGTDPVTALDKSPYQTGSEIGTGVLFGFIGGTAGNAIGQTNGGLIVESTIEIYNNLFDFTLTPPKH